MRIYSDTKEMVREVERDLWEMGIDVHPQTMQDKNIAGNPDYMTKELQSFGFQIVGSVGSPNTDTEKQMVEYIAKDPAKTTSIMDYIDQEFQDRIGGVAMNPGNAYSKRKEIWDDFLHNGRFAYTYSERMHWQVKEMLSELSTRPETRQAIITLHSNINTHQTLEGPHSVVRSQDVENKGARGRIPCSMYYQVMIRNRKVDLIYTMRSCDFLVHYPVDIALAMRLQKYFATQLGREVGMFTYFTGSLHAYRKDMQARGVF